jgi:hypothetical protein
MVGFDERAESSSHRFNTAASTSTVIQSLSRNCCPQRSWRFSTDSSDSRSSEFPPPVQDSQPTPGNAPTALAVIAASGAVQISAQDAAALIKQATVGARRYHDRSQRRQSKQWRLNAKMSIATKMATQATAAPNKLHARTVGQRRSPIAA